MISDTPEFKKFNEEDLKYNTITSVLQGNLYGMHNDGKSFMSLDLKHANFNILRWHNPGIVLNHETYEDLISEFTDLPYYHESKHIRQIIFGHLNPKRQRNIQRYFVQMKLIPFLRKELDYLRYDMPFVTASDDEVVIDGLGPDCNPPGELLMLSIDGLDGMPIHVDQFILSTIGNKPYFVKEYGDGSFELKSIPSSYYAECYKHYKGEPLEEYDLLTFHEGRILKFVDRLFDSV